MFAAWGRVVVRFRWAALGGGLVVVLAGVLWGSAVFGSLSGGGYDDPHSESSRVRAQVTREFGPQDPDVLVLYSSREKTVDDPGFRGPVTAALARVAAEPQVVDVRSWYGSGSPVLVSRDRHATYAVVRLRPGPDDQKLDAYQAIRSVFDAGHGVTTQLGGALPFASDANDQTARDIERAETFSAPVLLVLLVVIFGSVVAAASPLLIGVVAILGGFVVVRLLTYLTDVSTFAINIVTLIGLGLSIDYALFVVARFREELAAGRPVPDAVARTMSTAGRTVAVSGVTVTLALASLQLFPQGFLRSMSSGGMAAVAIAMLASLTVLPAWLAVLGPRIDAGRIRWPRRRGHPAATRSTGSGSGAADAGAGATVSGEAGTVPVGGPETAVAGGGVGVATGGAGAEHGVWARLAHSVMRHPWRYLVGVLVVLGVLAAPVAGIRFGGIDVRVMPPDSPSRIVYDRIAHEFPATSQYPVQVLATGVDPAATADLVRRIEALPHVTGVDPVAAKPGAVLLDVDYTGPGTGDDARDVVRAIRALPVAGGTTIGVTGYTADLVDQLAGLGRTLPWMLLFVVGITLVLLFFAFGSVVLPVKAVVMNAVSLGAAFGVVVFVFQQGHLASWLGYTSTGFIEPTDPILMIAVLFGLATDYEVFLLSRVREEWDRGADNTTAVAVGLQRTGRIITSAAGLLIVVVIGFATGRTGFVKLIGVGMIVAILVDATLVRALLVPATMRLLGRWNWWAPGPLRRLHARYTPHDG